MGKKKKKLCYSVVWWGGGGGGGHVCVCVYYCSTYSTKLFACVGGGKVEGMCYERRRAEACVDWSAHHALVTAGEREIV
jgi:hypothetical protein